MSDNLGRRRLPIYREVVNAVFKSPDYVEFNALPDDAVFYDSYYDMAKQTLFLIFSSTEWSEVEEGEDIPLLDYEVLIRKCRECESVVMRDTKSEKDYCPNCGVEGDDLIPHNLYYD